MKKILSIIMIILIVSQSCIPLCFATTTDGEQADGSGTASNETEEYVFVPMELSDFGLEMIKSFEGFDEYAHWDYSQWTIGYGTSCGENDYPNGITELEATRLMEERMTSFVNAVNNFMKNYEVKLNQNQFDALVSFSYNCGAYVWNKSLDDFTLKRLLVEGNWTDEEITEAFLMWVKAGGQVLSALVKRRTREANLFNCDIDIQGEGVKQYFVTTNTSDLNIRPTAGSTKYLGAVKNTIIIPVLEFSSDGKWAYTPYGAYFGWVSTSYIKPIEDAIVISEDLVDAQGVKYTLGVDYKTIIAGVPGEGNGNALYDGLGDGNVYLGRYIKHGKYVYQLSKIADGAFYGNTHLKTIYIPDSVKSIAENAFTNSSLEIIYCSEGSYAASYADAHGIPRMEYACRNGHTYNNAIWKTVREVSCTQDGLEGLCCDNCGYVSETRVYKAKLGHSYTEGKWQTITELGCTTDLVEGILCNNCAEARETRVVTKATGHSYTAGKFEVVTKENCVDTGLQAVICTTCGDHVETKVIPALGHTAGDWETLSTVSCTTDGVKIKSCTVCGDKVEENITKAHHTYNENDWQTTIEPTCTKVGERAVLCTICSEKVKTKSVDATGHSFDDWYVKTSPTYLKKGVLRRDCQKCTFNENKEIAVLKTEIVSDSLKLSDSDKTLVGILVNTKVSDVLAKIENSSDVKILDKNGKRLSDDDYIGSGAALVLYEGSKTLLSYSITVKGDTDGDGLASDWDCILLGRYLAGWDVDICTEALDFDNNGVVNDWDEILFSRYLASWDVKLW